VKCRSPPLLSHPTPNNKPFTPSRRSLNMNSSWFVHSGARDDDASGAVEGAHVRRQVVAVAGSSH
jgi:hypothetical protein